MLRVIVFLFILLPAAAQAQVVFISPLPFGIAQVHGDHADIRLHVAISGYSNFSYKLSSDTDTSPPQEGWSSIAVHNGVVDTLLIVPKSLRAYSLLWRTGLLPTDTNGTISGLTPGHIIGVAGQSNAVGWVWPPPGKFIAVARGDIRMLTNDTFWQPATEPTDGVAQGPWIEMANELYAKIGDSLPIGIVNTAVGGTGLTLSIGSGRWLKNSPDTNDKMYPNAVDRFRHAGSELECLTWIQGEADGQGGGVLWNPETYHTQFANLIQNFESDLADTFSVFHLQISGFSGNANSTGAYPIVREAQRVLPPSTLVGTAIGRPLWDSAFHYTVATYQAVGQMFAGAVLKELYDISAPMYPPLMPDTVATLDSITDGSIKGKYCFSIGWTRAGKPVTLTSLSAFQYFAIGESGIPVPLYDTSQVWYRISPTDPSRVQIGLRNDSIAPKSNYWFITYDAIANGENAPIATIDPTSGDTIFATAFYELPVNLSSKPPASVKELSIQSVVPNPATNVIYCDLLSAKHETVTIELLDNLGAILRSESITVEQGFQAISISTEGLASGDYWLVVRDENGNESIQKAAFFH
jgi:hypothetical protein